MSAHIAPDPPYVLLVMSDQQLGERVGNALYAGGFVPSSLRTPPTLSTTWRAQARLSW